MLEFFSKHKFYILILLLSLITFVTGFLTLNNSKTQPSDAATHTHKLHIDAQWKNPDGTTGRGAYIATDGFSYDEVVGKVYVNFDITANPTKGSYSGDSENTTMDGSEAVFIYEVGVGVGSSYSWIIYLGEDTIDGFSGDVQDRNTWWLDLHDDSAWVSATIDTNFDVFFSPWQYEIAWDANGGNFSGSSSVTSQVYFYEQYGRPSESLISPTDYEFAGWRTGINSGMTLFYDDQRFENTNYTTFYANWRGSLTLDGNGGWEDNSGNYLYPSSVYYNATPTIKYNFIKRGYTLTGWYTAASGGTKLFNADGSVVNGVNGYTDSSGKWIRSTGSALTIYAQWKVNSYELTLNRNYDNNDNTSTTEVVEYDQPISLTAPTRTGYNFLGYYTARTGGTQVFDANANLKNSVNGYSSSGLWQRVGNTTLYAQWEIKMTTITLYDGETEKGTMEVQYGSVPTVGSSLLLTKTGYTFNGYYTATSGGAQVFDSGGVLQSSVEGYSNSSGEWINENVSANLYAKWTANTYKAWFHANGGSVTTSNIDVTYGNAYGNLPTPTRTGYTFNGWKIAGANFSKTWSAGTSNNYSYQTVLSGITPGTTYDIFINKADITAGTSTKFDIRIYDFTASKQLLLSQHDEGTNIQVKITCPSSATAGNDIRIIVYAGIAGSTKNHSITIENFKVMASTTGYTTKTSTVATAYDHTLMADWKQHLNITLNNQSATSAGTGNVYFKHNENKYYSDLDCTTAITSITKPTKTGFTFGGYYTAVNGGGTQYINASGSFVNNLYSAVSSSRTLYAKWIDHSYTINFNGNAKSGYSLSGSVSSITATYTQEVTMPANGFTMNYWLFKGWATSATGDVAYKVGQQESGLASTDGSTITLYAVWEDTWANHATAPSGSGTQASPYLIASAENLAWISSQTTGEQTFSSKYFKQTANIDLSGYTWVPISYNKTSDSQSFMGNYQGNGYTISNITTSQAQMSDGNYSYSQQGLFGFTYRATLSNIILLTGTIYGYEKVGGIVGRMSNTTITNCQNYANITCSGNKAGGIAGADWYNTITNCYFRATLTCTETTGGLVGYSKGSTITSCGVDGTFNNTTSYLFVGKHMTDVPTTISDCFAVSSNNLAFSDNLTSMSNILYIANGTKKYIGSSSTFTNWVIPSWVTSSTTNRTPLPSGLSHLATGGTKVTGLSQIKALGYTLLS